MPNKKISQFPVTTSLAADDLFLINHIGTTSTVSFSALNDLISDSISIKTQTGTSYTISLTDSGSLITFSNSSPITLNVPTNVVTPFPIGTQMMISQIGTGQVTVSAVTPGTTSINGKNGTKTTGRYAIISLIKIATDSWIIGGDATI